MERHQPSAEKARIAELEAKLAEAEETLRAIHSGEVDALLVAGPEGDQVFTLQGADTTYRFLVEEMNEGALLLGPEGTILYANARFAQLASVPLEQVIGSPWERFFVAADQSRLDGLLATARVAPVRQELYLDGSGGSARPVAVSLSSMQREQVQGFSAVVTDLSERKAAEGALRDANEKLELRVQQRTDQLTQVNTLLLAEMGERKRTEEEVLRQREWLRVTLTSIGDAVIACDKDCRVTFINSAAVSLTGWQAEEAQGQPVTGVFKIINEGDRRARREYHGAGPAGGASARAGQPHGAGRPVRAEDSSGGLCGPDYRRGWQGCGRGARVSRCDTEAARPGGPAARPGAAAAGAEGRAGGGI